MKRRWLVPEVVQTSAMDCGPAALASLCEGLGVSASYGRLREACHTGVDGTSIDSIEDIANALGVEAEQVMIPVEELFEPEMETLPAIVVTRLPSGFTHFVVAWRTHGRFVQIMDPAVGRRFVTRRRLLADCYVHSLAVAPDVWRDVALAPPNVERLRRRLHGLGVADADALVDAAVGDPSWEALARLEAASRMAEAVAEGDVPAVTGQAAALFRRLWNEPEAVPETWWPVTAAEAGPDSESQVMLRGVVMVRALGRAVPPDPAPEPSIELDAARREPKPRPLEDLVRRVGRRGRRRLTVLAAGTVLSGLGVILEAVLLRGLFDHVTTGDLDAGRVAAVVGLAAALLLLGVPLVATQLDLGRRVEQHLRAAISAKLSRLPDGYLRSRPTSDMAERSHNLHRLRLLPEVGGQSARVAAELVFTAVGLVWLDPSSAVPAIVGSAVAVAVPLAFQPLLAERDLRLRTHQGALGQVTLDTLLGLVPVRAHRAQRGIVRAHDHLAAQWQGAARDFQRAGVTLDAVQAVVTVAVASWLLAGFAARRGRGDPSDALLFTYWALILPVLGYDLALALRRWPSLRTVTLRLLEPLASPEDADGAPAGRAAERAAATVGVEIEIDGVTVAAGGQEILREIDLHVRPGSHVAVVGPSGGGKSSLLGLLLGWHRPTWGAVRVDGEQLGGGVLWRLRAETAWVDPSVQLWNRSLAENLRYGTPPDAPPLDEVIGTAGLETVVSRLATGVHTPLGEGGGLVSGGEGQRVRLGRAMGRRRVRLVLLDEPFRGLDRVARARLLLETRHRWPGATVLCATHDLTDTLTFDRVLVVEDGRVVEDGPPPELAADGASRFRAMLDADTAAREMLFDARGWRHVRIEDGRFTESLDDGRVVASNEASR